MKYLIYDTALNSLHTLMILQKYYGISESLFKGTKDEALISVSPWLFLIDDKLNENLSHEMEVSVKCSLLFESWGDIHMVSTHFRKFIYQTINGREYFFRFYDPRVLEKFLPTCDKDQIREFFGPVQHFIVEGKSKEESIQLSPENGLLKRQVIKHSAYA